MHTAKAQLLADIEAFIAKHDLRASYFGRDVCGDFSLVNRLRRGGDVRLETADKIRRYMADYKPRPKPMKNSGPRRRINSKA